MSWSNRTQQGSRSNAENSQAMLREQRNEDIIAILKSTDNDHPDVNFYRKMYGDVMKAVGEASGIGVDKMDASANGNKISDNQAWYVVREAINNFTLATPAEAAPQPTASTPHQMYDLLKPHLEAATNDLIDKLRQSPRRGGSAQL